jgi:A/G-specific adenine glycosylase
MVHLETAVPRADWIRRVRGKLLSFFDERQRILPWRNQSDPYRIWVSEIMLQQTRVDAVIPYYERWLVRFPTLHSLAAADPEAVLRAWEGLGYYSRARNLQHAARRVMEQHGGRLPRDYALLRALPGIGDYTAGAIASIAFGQAEPAVDGNARRVLCRLLDLPNPSARDLRRIAKRLVPADRPAAFNQALMELGATICTARKPACLRCPLRQSCRARAHDTVALRPARKPKKDIPSFDVGTAVITAADGCVLLARRPARGLLAGLWEFPGEIARKGQPVRKVAAHAARHLTGAAPGRSQALGHIAHAFSHREEIYHVFRFDLASVPDLHEAKRECVWVQPADLVDLVLPAAQRRIAGLALGTEETDLITRRTEKNGEERTRTERVRV